MIALSLPDGVNDVASMSAGGDTTSQKDTTTSLHCVQVVAPPVLMRREGEPIQCTEPPRIVHMWLLRKIKKKMHV